MPSGAFLYVYIYINIMYAHFSYIYIYIYTYIYIYIYIYVLKLQKQIAYGDIIFNVKHVDKLQSLQNGGLRTCITYIELCEI